MIIALANSRTDKLLMIHNPLTVAIGDSEEMQKAIAMLNEVKESIINAYEIKTGQSRTKLAHLMDAETWLNANKALELGFADDIMFKENQSTTQDSFTFSRKAVTNSLLNKLSIKQTKTTGTPINVLETRLNLLK